VVRIAYYQCKEVMLTFGAPCSAVLSMKIIKQLFPVRTQVYQFIPFCSTFPN